MPEKFWAEDPCILLTNIRLFPLADFTQDEKLNALTRLAIAISAVLYFMKYEFWFTFLILALLGIILVKYGHMTKDNFTQKKDSTIGEAVSTGAGEGAIAGETPLVEDFTLVPTYASPDMHITTIAPIFSEEWQVYPPAYDILVNTPPDVTFEEPLQPQSYPYGQYLTRTNLLPSDEYGTHMLNGGTKQARSYINSRFLAHDLAFRDNMTKLYKKKLARRWRNNCNDTFSPFNSY